MEPLPIAAPVDPNEAWKQARIAELSRERESVAQINWIVAHEISTRVSRDTKHNIDVLSDTIPYTRTSLKSLNDRLISAVDIPAEQANTIDGARMHAVVLNGVFETQLRKVASLTESVTETLQSATPAFTTFTTAMPQLWAARHTMCQMNKLDLPIPEEADANANTRTYTRKIVMVADQIKEFGLIEAKLLDTAGAIRREFRDMTVATNNLRTALTDCAATYHLTSIRLPGDDPLVSTASTLQTDLATATENTIKLIKALDALAGTVSGVMLDTTPEPKRRRIAPAGDGGAPGA